MTFLLNETLIIIAIHLNFRYGDVYLCGHLHTLGNTVTMMHAVHRDGHLELELADWKDNRRY